MNLFEESNDRFNMLVNVCWASMFRVKLLFDHPILNVALFVDAMKKNKNKNLIIGFYYIIVIIFELLILIIIFNQFQHLLSKKMYWNIKIHFPPLYDIVNIYFVLHLVVEEKYNI